MSQRSSCATASIVVRCGHYPVAAGVIPRAKKRTSDETVDNRWDACGLHDAPFRIVQAELFSTAPISTAAASRAPDTVAEVRGVFAAKCSGCHGPDLVKPKGRFGYVLDLHRIAENPEMVIPSRPDESELWLLVKEGEMPPPDSPRGPLSEAEKQIIRSWIADGARDAAAGSGRIAPQREQKPAVELKRAAEPKPLAAGDGSPTVATLPNAAASPASSSFIPRELLWFGRFHLLAIHFPIALIIAAAIGEFWSAWRRSTVYLQSVSFCVRLAAIAALPTVALGWRYAAAGNGAGYLPLLTVHRWLDSATGTCIIAAAICCELDRRRAGRCRLFQVLLTLGVVLTVVTAHLGALVVHGLDFFAW